MLSIVIDLHQNISSSQCLVKFCGNDVSVNQMEIIGTKTELTICLLKDYKISYKTKISTPKDFFIPTSILLNENTTTCLKEKTDVDVISNNLRELHSLSEHQIDSDSKFQSNCTLSDSINASLVETTEQQIPILKIKDDCFKLLLETKCSNNHLLSSKHIITANFRLKFTKSNIIPIRSIETLSLITPQEFLKSQLQLNTLHNVICTNCDCVFTLEPILLKDVKRYNASISDLSENWFCHQHESTCPVMSKDILYVDELCILLDSSFVENAFLEKQGTEYKCKRCNSILTSKVIAFNSQNFRRFFTHAIKFNSIDSILPSNLKKYKHDTIMLLLLNIIKDNKMGLSTCKLYFQSNVVGEEDCLLLRIMPFQSDEFTFQCSVASLPEETVFTTNKVYKIQYHITSRSSPIVKIWRRDFDVEFFDVCDLFLKIVIQHLKSSSEIIPTGQTVMNDFYNACLPCTYENCCF